MASLSTNETTSGSEVLSEEIDETQLVAGMDHTGQTSEGFFFGLGVVHSTPWSIFITLLVLVSLFLQPLNLNLGTYEGDLAIAIIYIVMGAFFLLEILVLCIFQDGYFVGNNIFLWVDAFALLSMIPDCIPLSMYNRFYTQNNTNFFDSVIAAIRLFRLFRLWKIFRVFNFIEIYSGNTFTYPETIGKNISTHTIMKLGVLMIFLTGMITILRFDAPYIGPPMALLMLEEQVAHPEYDTLVTVFLRHYPNTILLEIDSVTLFQHDTWNATNLRTIEMEDFTTLNNGTILTLDVRETVKAWAIIEIFFTIIIGLIFFVVVVIVNADAKKKLITPFDSILSKILRISGMMHVRQKTDLEVTNPYKYYINTLTRMRTKAAEYVQQ